MSHDDFVSVYRHHVDFVWRLTRSMGVEASAAEDVVHEVFIVVQRKLPSREYTGALRPWLAGITRNTVLHHRRRRAREARRLSLVLPPEPPPQPEDTVGLQQAAALMQRFLDGLPAKKRDVFVLMEIEGLSAPEVARLLGIKVPTVYSRLHSARQLLDAFTERLERRGSLALGGERTVSRA